MGAKFKTMKLKWQKTSSYTLLCIGGIFLTLGWFVPWILNLQTSFINLIFDIPGSVFIVLTAIKVSQELKQTK